MALTFYILISGAQEFQHFHVFCTEKKKIVAFVNGCEVEGIGGVCIYIHTSHMKRIHLCDFKGESPVL